MTATNRVVVGDKAHSERLHPASRFAGRDLAELLVSAP